MSSNSLGTIITGERSPSTSEFMFVLEKEDSVKKGQYVQASNSHGTIFGYVNELIKVNKYFERAESVAEYERVADMANNFPINAWEHTIAEVKILGSFDNNGNVVRTTLPPSPGAKIFDANVELLRQFLGFTEDGLHIGLLQHHELEVKLNLTRLLQKHLAILAMSGAGKSHLASVILEELLERSSEKGRIAVIVVDIHGEYCGFASDPKYKKDTEIIEGKDIRIPLKKLSPELIEEWMPHTSQPAKELLRRTLYDLKTNSKEQYSLKELFAAIEASDQNVNVKKPLVRALEELKRLRFLSRKAELPQLSKTVQPGKLLLLDFSTIDSLRKKQILVTLIARRLFRLRKKRRIPPFLLLVEEAHNFAREKAEAHEALSRAIIETIAREGRKFGASLCLISQRPVNLSTTALSQCGTHIILRVTNPNDLDHIQASSEGIDARVARAITGLQPGEAIIVGSAVNSPLFLTVRQRKSVKKERGIPLHEQAIEFERKEKEMKENVEAFL